MMKKKCATVFGWILHLCSKIYSITPQAIHITSELHRLWIKYQHSFKGLIKCLQGSEKMGKMKNQDVQRGRTNAHPLMTLTKNNIRDTQCVKSSWSPVCWVLCSLHFLMASWGHGKPLSWHVTEGKPSYLFHVWLALRHKEAICDDWPLATVSFSLRCCEMFLFLLRSALKQKKTKQTMASLRGEKVLWGAAVCVLGDCPCVRKLSGMQACIHTPSVWINWPWMRRWMARSGRQQSGVPGERPTTPGENRIEMSSEVRAAVCIF